MTIIGNKSLPEDQRPERTGKAEENCGDYGAQKAQQENGLAPDVIRKTAPLEHSDRFGSIMQRHLRTCSAFGEYSWVNTIRARTHYHPRVVSNLPLVTTSDGEIANKLNKVGSN